MDLDLLNEYFDYNSDSGKITWVKNFFKTKIGKEAGGIGQMGYIKITLNGVTLLAHRIAWAIHYNEQPPEIIDHINGDRADNRIENLRSCTNAENIQNQRTASRSNKTSKYLGVSNFKGKWRAKIKANGKYIFLGYFDSEEGARDAYLKAKRKVHKSCTI